MFAMNKDTLMMVAVVVALLAIFLLYRDSQKLKLEVQNLSSDRDRERDRDAQVIMPLPPVPVQKKAVPAPPVVADETE